MNLHLAVDKLTRLLTENAAISVCDRYFNEATSLYTSLYYERGSEQDLHRDTPYFTTNPPGRYLGVWVALDDVRDDNGPLHVVPNSHKLPPIDIASLRQKLFGDGPVPSASDEGWMAYQSAVKQQCDDAGLSSIPVHVNVGDVIIWHPEMFHGGAPHHAARSRRSLVMHVTPKGTAVGHQDAFYNPATAQQKASWNYYQRNTRYIAEFGQVSFGHQYDIPTSQLKTL